MTLLSYHILFLLYHCNLRKEKLSMGIKKQQNL